MQKIKFIKLAILICMLCPMALFAQDTLSLSELTKRVKKGEIKVEAPVEKGKATKSKTKESEASTSTGMQKIFYQTVDEAIYLVRQDYGVRKSNDKVAVKPDKSYWGQAYGIGVMAQMTKLGKKKLFLAKSVQEPWRTDKSHKKVDEGKGEPFGLRLAMSPISETDFEEVKVKTVEINDKVGSYRFKEDTRKTIKGSSGKTEGFVVIYYTDDEVGDDMKVKKKVMSFEPKWKEGGGDAPKSVNIDADLDANILGGAYFEQKISTGKIEFRLAGIYDDGKIWSVASTYGEEKD